GAAIGDDPNPSPKVWSGPFRLSAPAITLEAVMARAQNLPEGTVTFLFSDIEGSTRLLKELGRERYGGLLRQHNEVLRNAFAGHDGIEIDRQGDAFFFVFRSAGAAVAAAVAAQRAMAAADWPEDGQVRVRIGLHTG